MQCYLFACLSFYNLVWNHDSFWTSPSALSYPFKCPHLLHLPFPNRAKSSPHLCPLSLLPCVVRVILHLLKTPTSQSLFLKQWPISGPLVSTHLKLWGKGSVVWLTLQKGPNFSADDKRDRSQVGSHVLTALYWRGVLSCPLEGKGKPSWKGDREQSGDFEVRGEGR